MKWLLLAFQLFNSHRSLMQTRALMERAKGAAEKSKKMAFFSFTMMLFLVYFITGSIVIAINLGTQLDSGYGLKWSGMLWAGLGLIFFGIMLLTVGFIVLKIPADDEDEEEVAKTKPKTQDLGVLIDQLAVTFVSQMIKSLNEKIDPATKPRAPAKTE